MSDEQDKFSTLRGIVRRNEPDEPLYFSHSATLRIVGVGLDFAAIESVLKTAPTRSHRAGEKHGERGAVWPADLWSLDSGLPESAPLSDHIDALWVRVRHATPFLKGLKQHAKVDVFLGYRSNCDHAGIEVRHTSLEMFRELEIPFGVSIIIT